MPSSDTVLLVVSVAVVGLLVLLSFVSIHNHRKTTDLTPNMTKRIQNLIRTACSQASKAKQDSNPIVALMHCYNAKSYIDACQYLSGDNLRAMTESFGIGIDEDIRENIHTTIQTCMQKITAQCPSLSIKGAEHFSIGAGWVA